MVKPLDPEMLADAASHRLVITVEDGLRDGGIGAAIADSLSVGPGRRAAGPCARRAVGVPGPGQADAILSRLGLDADGIADEALAWIRSADRTVWSDSPTEVVSDDPDDGAASQV